ncbi:MAG: ABC transporter permease [Lachnospiraceae bacterium]|jgi:D-methionine transport system permease protein|nr:ABC transporter permease [Lachnospiraceae bacterium]MCI1399074.1 ABC transporter permease [Lachnospiraceae bacterium]MCI1423784.1 ABC transporter permease [Lachnospiraceae bacterium]MCI1452568.1 ABC transporter permease [Lachnospiraceae bacterium]MDD5849425.1 ABC transporter permease [Bacillota bacterium]
MTANEINMILTGVWQTVYMTLVSTLFGYVLGLPWGIALTVTAKEGLHPNKVVYRILDIAANIMRSVPFLIMLILVMPLTMLIVGKTYGSTATVVPLVISAAPLIARMVESSLNEVDHGVIEAAQSVGATNFQIVTRVLIGEARVSLVSGATITIGTVLGYSAMAGTIGGGGLGDIAIRYGYYRYQADILWTTVILLVLLVQLFQAIGTLISVRMDKRHI